MEEGGEVETTIWQTRGRKAGGWQLEPVSDEEQVSWENVGGHWETKAQDYGCCCCFICVIEVGGSN